MSQDRWSAVDQFIVSNLIPSDPALEASLQASATAGLPPINVSPTQGKLLHLLARSHGAKRILEIGTLGGYSTIWLARALPSGGRLISLEIDPKHAAVARANLSNAGVGALVDVRVGRALDLLPALSGSDPFDMVFIDADKPSNPDYLAWALRLTRVGSLIIIDNVVRHGALADAGSTDPNVLGSRRVHELVAKEPRLTATTIQTVGSKGYDGMLFAIVTG